MKPAGVRTFKTPRDGDLCLARIANRTGLAASVLPNGFLFALEHEEQGRRIMLGQVLGSPLTGGIARIQLRIGGRTTSTKAIVGPGARVGFAAGEDRITWEGETHGARHRVTLWLAPDSNVWLWRIEITNGSGGGLACDAVLVQDLGLGERGFLMNNEAYASQYIDHHIAHHSQCGPVVMSRQNLAQRGTYPWAIHGCIERAAGYATDAAQIFGPAFRDRDGISLAFGQSLPSERLQHEVACVAIQSPAARLKPGATAEWTFFGLYVPDHTEASSSADLEKITAALDGSTRYSPSNLVVAALARNVVQDAPPLIAETISDDELARHYPERRHEERMDGALASFFTPDGAHNRHVVLAAKEHMIARRHGTLLRSGESMLPDESTLCATCWMHGVFAAQLTIGNTSFHKLFSVSRDPYNITRSSGLRIFVDGGAGWRLLAVPTLFEMGLSDCQWIYRTPDRSITVHAIASGDDPAMQWRITVEGGTCRLLVVGHLVLGERELDQSGRIEIDGESKRFSFRPDPDWLWGKRYPDAQYHLVTSTPAAIEAIGGDELLYEDGASRGGGYAVLQTRQAREVVFAVTGSLKDAREAERLAAKYEQRVADVAMLAPADRYWTRVTCRARIRGGHPDAAALDTILPWLAHNAMIHLTVPHGLEQYTGAAWGTRDVCQGPIEFLLAFEHDETAKQIVRSIFAEQFDERGDWPQWFMLDPYSNIRDRHAHGDVIVWPLKAVCDYLEATNDLAFLDEAVQWRRQDNFDPTERRDTIAAHVDKLIATVRERFIPGTHLLRYGEGDWNDSLQPADPKMRDWMVSSWTVVLFFQQIQRYAEVLRRAGRAREGKPLERLAAAIREDFNRHLIRGETVAGYALFEPGWTEPELLLHPSDARTGLKFSLLPMTRSIIAGLFTPEQAAHHLRLIRDHLLFPDGVRLIDRPVSYRGGPEHLFRRAESSSFFGREIGLMYVHAHLRYAEALAAVGDAAGLWDALLKASPIAVTEHLANASARQRNAYFSSSDAHFRDRYQASTEWNRVKAGDIAVDGGWRIYSSGPGLYMNMLIRHALGQRRYFGERVSAPLLPSSVGEVRLERTSSRPPS